MAINDMVKQYHESRNDSSLESHSFRNITTSTTTVVKAGKSFLKSIVINSKGTGASTTTIYNNTSATGTKIATIDSLNLSGVYTFECACTLGITVVTTGTVAPNVTVLYR